MAHSTLRRHRVKPDKPERSPLFPHATGRWAKKVRGKLHYFGSWEDYDGALQKYKDQREDLEAGRTPRGKSTGGLTIRDLCNQFRTSKKRRLESGELSPSTYKGYVQACDLIIDHFGKYRTVASLEPSDFEGFRAYLAQGRGLVSLGNLVNRTKIVFNYAAEIDEHFRKSPVWFGKGFKKPKPEKVDAEREANKHENGERDFTAAEIKQLLKRAGLPLKAMILLGINCGFGNTDCSRLPRKVLEDAIASGWINYPRPKTSKKRRCKLWPETVKACKAALRLRVERDSGPAKGLAFVTKYGAPWVKEAGNDDAISKEFRKLCVDAGVHRKGISFYGLRRAFATVGSECRDQVAVDCCMGHRDYSMSGLYRQRVSDERLAAVADTVRTWLFGKKAAK